MEWNGDERRPGQTEAVYDEKSLPNAAFLFLRVVSAPIDV